MADLDRLLRSDVAVIAAEQAHAPDFEAIQRRGVQRRRRRSTLLAGALAAAVVGAVVALSQVLPGRTDAAPTYPVDRSTDRPTGPWSALRAPERAVGRESVLDPADTTNAVIDIRRAEAGEFGGNPTTDDFRIELADTYAGESTAGQQIEYGVVIDTDGDLQPDCHLGISNPNDGTAQPPGLHVWLRNLRTGRADDRVGGPYGVPFDFSFPEAGPGATVSFFFLDQTHPPCDGYGPGDHFYAYSSLTENGQVTAWDFAPDSGWLGFR